MSRTSNGRWKVHGDSMHELQKTTHEIITNDMLLDDQF